MNRIWSIYHNEIPPFLREFAATPPLLRLQRGGMNCGCEYTNFPRFRELRPYSRYDHSVGAALIVWHFTESAEQSLAALFHDVTTPVFAHVVDFLNGDHVRQESTEAGIEEFLREANEIRRHLKKYGLVPEQVSDYHRYPIADNDSPALSADRLEYTLGNLLNYGFADMEELRTYYRDLVVGEDELGRPELVFKTPEVAESFAAAALKTAAIYVADEDRYAMEALAHLLRQALARGVLRGEDLWTTEPEVIEKLNRDPVCAEAWKRYCGYSRIIRSESCPDGDDWIRVDAKKRWIDPIARGLGRVSRWSPVLCAEMESFQKQDFTSIWLRAE